MRNKLLYILLGLLVIGVVNGQSVPLQSIKGRITERNIKTVIAAATIKVIGMDEKTAVSDSSGFLNLIIFRLEEPPF